MEQTSKQRDKFIHEVLFAAIIATALLVLMLLTHGLSQAQEKAELTIRAGILPIRAEIAGEMLSLPYAASRNGSRYYPRGCSGVSRINPENLIGFSTRGEAEAMGYTPAKSCSW